ncbi:CoA transferase [Pseudorhodoplanes sinuspersici]|uniref:CoA transferase n=1 Tax=Pseudorhodoplanes sinuspersici TaxID=1235591 RepID=UPI000E72C98F
MRAIISERTAAEWEPTFKAACCCVTIVPTFEEVLADPHFESRGVFRAEDEDGLPLLPLPISSVFRQPS